MELDICFYQESGIKICVEGSSVCVMRFVCQRCLNYFDQEVHLDINAVNNRTRDGQPKGGEAQGLMCIFDMLTEWIKR